MEESVLHFSNSCCNLCTLALLLKMFNWKKKIIPLMIFKRQTAETTKQRSVSSSPCSRRVLYPQDHSFYLRSPNKPVILLNTDLPQQEIGTHPFLSLYSQPYSYHSLRKKGSPSVIFLRLLILQHRYVSSEHVFSSISSCSLPQLLLVATAFQSASCTQFL